MASELSELLNKNAPVTTLQAKAQAFNETVAKLEAARTKTVNFAESNYSQKRKDAAMWAKTPEDADKQVRSVLENVWKTSTDVEKQAAYYYTSGSSYINEPLRGQTYLGYNGRNSKIDIDNLTNMINRSSYDFDIWVQRGVSPINVKSIFGIDLDSMNIADAKKLLLGKTGIEPAFASCGDSKGAGFSNNKIIYNIYCPKGTKMLYAEPFSQYGKGAKSPHWDGKSTQKNFGYEAEMILQRGTKFRVSKIEHHKGIWYIDLDVIGQM
jgi:hypothetical protein